MHINTPIEFEPTIERPLAEFDFFYLDNRGINLLKNSFEEDKEYLDIIKINTEEFSYTIYEQNNLGEYEFYETKLNNILYKILYRMFIKARDLIYKRVDECSNTTDNKDFLKKQLDILQSLYKIPIPAFAEQWKQLYHKPIISIIYHIKERYHSSLNFRHSVFKQISKKECFDIFGYIYSINTIKKLYEIIFSLMEEEINCTEDNDEQFEKFRKILTAINISEITPFQVKFNNKYLSIIIKELEPLFSNLSPTTIIENNAIIKNENTYYNTQLLYSAYNKLKLSKQDKYLDFQKKLRTKLLDFTTHH